MVYLIGPYFTENTVLRNMELAMRQLQNLNLSVETTMQIEKALKALPTLATNIMNHYAITLNYCVTGVQKNTFDIYNITDEDYGTVDVEEQLSTRDRHKVWTTEQAAAAHGARGRSELRPCGQSANSVSNGVKVVTNEILGQARTSVIVFTSLCCRAAIEGGLSPEEGYTLGDATFSAPPMPRTARSWASFPTRCTRILYAGYTAAAPTGGVQADTGLLRVY